MVGETNIFSKVYENRWIGFVDVALFIFSMSDYGGRHFVNLVTLPKSKNTYLQDLVDVLYLKQFKLITLYKKNAYWTLNDIILHFNGCYFDFWNSEVMTSLPHNLALYSQPRFGLTQSDF